MRHYSTSKQLKAHVREALLGNYSTLIFSYIIIECITSLALNFVQSQIASAAGEMMYWGVYLLMVLLMGVFTVGQFYMYRKLLGGEVISTKDMWFGFKYHPDKAIVLTLINLLLCCICSVPFFLFTLLYAQNGKNVTMFMCSMLSLAFLLIAALYINLCLSQVSFLLLDYPAESAIELCKHSNALMKGHKLRLLIVYISFIGMFFLILITFGIATLWVYPYLTGVRAYFYEELVAEPYEMDKNEIEEAPTSTVNIQI